MQRCIDLALKGLGRVAPNPMVGAVLVHHGRIVSEGYHEAYGQSHAEVNAIRYLADQALLHDCTLYVNLEPCSHHGKTPPCADLIIEKGIPRVVIGNLDTNPLVAGRGIARLQAAGVEVIHGVLHEACRELNKRFFTYHEQQRPYIILKWAETADGFISRLPLPADKATNHITGDESRRLVHLWRSQEQAIMVGRHTVVADDPQLTTRLVEGRNPLRVLLDRHLQLGPHYAVFNGDAHTLVFTEKQHAASGTVAYASIDFDQDVLPQVLKGLHQHSIASVIVEGGTVLLQSFINSGLWDEARVFVNPHLRFGQGVKAPVFDHVSAPSQQVGNDVLYLRKHH